VEFTAFLQAVPPSPGHGEAAPAPHAGTAPPDGSAPPGAPPGGALGTFMPLLFVLPMILVMLWMNRSQQKKQKDLEDKLKVGDRVITQSGLVGKRVERGERRVKIEIAPGIKVEMLRTAIAGLDAGDEAPKSAAGAK
jgi:preprotein translocase subunit YajC